MSATKGALETLSTTTLYMPCFPGFASLVERILEEHGFSANPAKHVFGSLTNDLSITSLRPVRGHLDVEKEYLDELIRQLDDAASLARNEEFEGPYYAYTQIRGRVRFVCWVNRGRRRELIRRFNSIRWNLVAKHAKERGYVRTETTLQRLDHGAAVDDSVCEPAASTACPFEA